MVVACGDAAVTTNSAVPGSGSAKKSAAPATSAPSAKPSAAPAATSAATPAKPPVLGMCENKDAGWCKEYVGVLGAEAACVGADKKGVFKKGTDECTHVNALGTCEVKVEGGGEMEHHYKKDGMDEAKAKAACDGKKGVWIPEPAGASSASPATSGAPSAAPSATPTAAPKK